MIKHIAEFDASVADQEAKKCIYRIYRDLRFTPDKRPYKIHFGAYIAMGGKSLNNAGYYVHIQNNMSFRFLHQKHNSRHHLEIYN